MIADSKDLYRSLAVSCCPCALVSQPIVLRSAEYSPFTQKPRDLCLISLGKLSVSFSVFFFFRTRKRVTTKSESIRRKWNALASLPGGRWT